MVGIMFAGMAGGMTGQGMGQMADAFLSAKWDKRMQKRAFRFAREMAQNKYRWAVNDLREAGLNTILAAGGGISAPGAAGAPMGAGAPNRQRDVASTALAHANLKNINEQSRLAYQQGGTAKAVREAQYGLANKYAVEARHVMAQLEGQRLQNILLGQEIPGARARADLYKNAPWLKQAQEILNTPMPSLRRVFRRGR